MSGKATRSSKLKYNKTDLSTKKLQIQDFKNSALKSSQGRQYFNGYCHS